MARSHDSEVVSRRLLRATIVALVVVSLLPTRMSRWLDAFSGLALVVVAPISHPIASGARWLVPSQRSPDPLELRLAEEQRDHFQSLYLRQHEETQRLRQIIADLQAGAQLAPDLAVRQITAPVIGTSSDRAAGGGGRLRLRAGTADGVEINTVAAIHGVHVLGRVVKTAARTCEVQPITDRASGPLSCVIISDDQTQLLCHLTPTGDGALKGPVEHPSRPSGAKIPLKPGTRVWLNDDAWPRSARMLVVGTIESIQQDEQMPLRSIITVRPSVRLSRVSEAILRVHDNPNDTDIGHANAEPSTGGLP